METSHYYGESNLIIKLLIISITIISRWCLDSIAAAEAAEEQDCVRKYNWWWWQGNGIGKRKIITAVRRCAPSSRANCFDHIVGVKICGFALLKNQCVIW